MAAATQDRNTNARAGQVLNFPVAAATKIFAGTLVAINAAGNAVPAADAAGLKVVGRAQEFVDNSAGAAGDLSVDVARGVFPFDNSVADAVTAAELLRIVYVEDDQTVGKVGGDDKIAAGLAVAIEGDQVWVDTTLAPLAV